LSDLSFLKQIPDPLPAETGEAGGTEPVRAPQEASPTRGAIRRRRAAALALSLGWLGAHLAMYGIREDFAGLPAGYIAAQVALPIVFGACCLVVALAPGKLGLGLGVGLITAMALLGPASFWALALAMPVPHSPVPGGLGFWVGSLLCLDITLSFAAAPLLMVALSLRRAFSTGAARRSALVGGALGLLSGAAINLHCTNVDRLHILTGHGLPVLIAALLGAALVVRWTRA
jgi:hypothetical protein